MKIPFISSIPSFSSVKAGIGSTSSKLWHLFSTNVWRNLPSARSVANVITSHPILLGSLTALVIGGTLAYRYREEIGEKISSLYKKCFNSAKASSSTSSRAEQEMQELEARTTKAAAQAREGVRRRVAAASGKTGTEKTPPTTT